MISKITAVRFRRTGPPADVVEVERLDLPPLLPNQVLVKMHAAPINPADLNMLEGRYAVQPTLPAVAGIEGIGVVAKTGVAVSGFRAGDQVIAPLRVGTWCEACIAQADELLVLPPGMPVEQAAMIAVNPPTAWQLLHGFARVDRGDWLIQNAANSGVGRSVIQIARYKGLKTVSIVRRPEVVDELRKIGGDVVVVHGPDMREEILQTTGKARIGLGLNATCGPMLKDMADCLADGAMLVTYGAMAREPFVLSNRHLLFRDITVRGFWLTAWYRKANAAEKQALFARLCPMVKDGFLHTPVQETYPLYHARDAVAAAAGEKRRGKILFAIG
jgi:mitochondrial enoyl-[acyl-carrier protein] reductase / trans-2-enoyl-CoA reductase